MTLPSAQLVHHALGRTRFRVPDKRRDTAYFERVAAALSRGPGVESVQYNPVTGSVLALHHGDPAALARAAEAEGLFRLAADTPKSHGVTERVAERFQSLNRQLKFLSRGELDLPGLLFLGLIAMAVEAIRREQIIAPASTLLWYALSVVIMFVQRQQNTPARLS